MVEGHIDEINLVKEALVAEFLEQLVLEESRDMTFRKGDLFRGGQERIGDVSVKLIVIVCFVGFVDPLDAINTGAQKS